MGWEIYSDKIKEAYSKEYELAANPVERGVKWAKFKQEEDIKLEKKRIEAEKRANRSHNQGLLKGLGWRKLYLFPFLMRKPT